MQKLVKFGRVVFELCEQTDRQTEKETDILITILRTPSEVITRKLKTETDVAQKKQWCLRLLEYFALVFSVFYSIDFS